MRRRGQGSIVITASLLGIVGDPGMPAYGAMKGGLRSMTRALAAAHGPEGIRVNTVCPGDVDTALLDDFFSYQADPQAARDELLGRYPLRRFATPEDVANAVLFLASDEAAHISGIDLVVDGGLLAQIY
jgi:NAD(P)-dependent dehydrogenase (short-subunit alcohol dehydrogenase family)